MAVICNAGCANGTITQLDWNSFCNDKPRPGGISRFWFLKADADLSNLPYPGGLDNFENIKHLVCDGEALFSGKLMGTMPDAADNMLKVDSCSPEKAISRVWTITAKDMINYNDTDTDRGSEYDFWNNVRKNAKCFLVGVLTCDDRLYTWSESFSLKSTEMIEDSSQGSSMFNHTITIVSTPDLVKPYFVDGLNEWVDEHTPAQACYYNN